MQAIMSDQQGSSLESSGNGFFIGHVLLVRYIDGPGDEGRATPLHDPKNYLGRDLPRGKASQSVKLVLAGIMAVGTPMSAGSGGTAVTSLCHLRALPTVVRG
jgi:hypothetical protein